MYVGNRLAAKTMANVMYYAARILLSQKDETIAKFVSVVATIAVWLKVDEEMTENLKDIEKIFRAGAPGTEIVRQMIEQGRPYRVKSLFRGAVLYK